jgi:hypothetical protein
MISRWTEEFVGVDVAYSNANAILHDYISTLSAEIFDAISDGQSKRFMGDSRRDSGLWFVTRVPLFRSPTGDVVLVADVGCRSRPLSSLKSSRILVALDVVFSIFLNISAFISCFILLDHLEEIPYHAARDSNVLLGRKISVPQHRILRIYGVGAVGRWVVWGRWVVCHCEFQASRPVVVLSFLFCYTALAVSSHLRFYFQFILCT